MDEVRAHRRPTGRGPQLPRADREAFGWLCILAFSAGLDVVGIEEALRNDNTIWALSFCVITATTVGFYIWVAKWLIRGWV